MREGQGTYTYKGLTKGHPDDPLDDDPIMTVITYVGSFKNNERNGHGKQTAAYGETYEGEFKDGLYEDCQLYLSWSKVLSLPFHSTTRHACSLSLRSDNIYCMWGLRLCRILKTFLFVQQKHVIPRHYFVIPILF
jgi:hypothetical protein